MALSSVSNQGVYDFVEEASYGTDPGSGYLRWAPKTMPDLTNLKRTMAENETLVAANYTLPMIKGVNSDATIGLEWWMRGYSESIPTAMPVAADANPDIIMLGHMLGANYFASAATALPTVAAAPAPTVSVFTVTATTDLKEGQICVIKHAATSTYEAFRIAKLDTLEVTTTSPLRAVPVTGDTIYASMMAFMTDAPDVATLTQRVLTRVNDTTSSNYMSAIMRGCRATSGSLSFSAGEYLSLSGDFMIGDFAVNPTESDPPEYEADAFPAREAIIGSKVYWRNRTIDAQGCFEASTIEVDFGLDIKRPKSMCDDVQATAEPIFGQNKVQITLNPLFKSDFFPDFDQEHRLDILIQIGSVPGKMIVVAAPNCSFGEQPAIVDDDGIARQSIVLQADVYSGDGSDATTRDTSALSPKDASFAVGIV